MSPETIRGVVQRKRHSKRLSTAERLSVPNFDYQFKFDRSTTITGLEMIWKACAVPNVL
jgi:hypothetical protein